MRKWTIQFVEVEAEVENVVSVDDTLNLYGIMPATEARGAQAIFINKGLSDQELAVQEAQQAVFREVEACATALGIPVEQLTQEAFESWQNAKAQAEQAENDAQVLREDYDDRVTALADYIRSEQAAAEAEDDAQEEA